MKNTYIKASVQLPPKKEVVEIKTDDDQGCMSRIHEYASGKTTLINGILDTPLDKLDLVIQESDELFRTKK